MPAKHTSKLVITALIILTLDQLSKYFFRIYPEFYHPRSFFGLYLTKNYGIAFSIPLQGLLLYFILSLIVCILPFLLHRYIRWNQQKSFILTGLIIGGAIGNLSDRLIHGYVIDFIKIGAWPMFNLADLCISAGAISFLIWHKALTK